MNNEEIKQWFIDNKRIYFSSIELTQKCNFNCKHCYCTDKKNDCLSYYDFKIIIDKIYETGCLFLTLTGGEILTHPQFSDIYLYAKNKGFIVDLMTNASLINDDIVVLFEKYPPRNIAITLYGTSEEEYELFTGNAKNYTLVMNALERLKASKISYSLRTVATKCFYSSLNEGKFDEIANSFDVPFRFDPIVFPSLSGDKTPLNESLTAEQIVCLEYNNALRNNSWKRIVNENKEFIWHCNAGYSSFAVDYKGDAYLCGLYRNCPISILNKDIYTVLEHLRRLHDDHVKIVNNNECSRCDMRKICKWCPAYAFIYSGKLDKKIDFFCQLSMERKKRFE